MCIAKINYENNNRKRKILLSTLIPSSVIIIALVIFLGCFFGCKKTDSNYSIRIKTEEELNSYLNKHKSSHDETHTWTSTTDSQMIDYLNNNVNLQNAVNGSLLMMWYYFTTASNQFVDIQKRDDTFNISTDSANGITGHTNWSLKLTGESPKTFTFCETITFYDFDIEKAESTIDYSKINLMSGAIYSDAGKYNKTLRTTNNKSEETYTPGILDLTLACDVDYPHITWPNIA